jgi:hypothetical protein
MMCMVIRSCLAIGVCSMRKGRVWDVASRELCKARFKTFLCLCLCLCLSLLLYLVCFTHITFKLIFVFVFVSVLCSYLTLLFPDV